MPWYSSVTACRGVSGGFGIGGPCARADRVNKQTEREIGRRFAGMECLSGRGGGNYTTAGVSGGFGIGGPCARADRVNKQTEREIGRRFAGMECLSGRGGGNYTTAALSS